MERDSSKVVTFNEKIKIKTTRRVQFKRNRGACTCINLHQISIYTEVSSFILLLIIVPCK